LKANNFVKLCIDQFVFSPFFNSAIVGLRLFLLGTDINEIPSLVISTVPKTMLYAWLFWIPIRYLTLKHCPPAYQLITGSLFSIVWNVIFSFVLKS
jgi:hypothetical protein